MTILNYVNRSVLNFVNEIGLNIQKYTELEIELNKLQKIKETEKRLNAARDLSRKYPKHPGPHLVLLECMNELSDIQVFGQMDRYGEVRREWLIQTGLEELDMEFIWPGMVMGSVGNHYAIEGLLKANQYGLRSAKKLFLLFPENAQLRNPALFSYFEPYLNVIRDEESIKSLKRLESILTLSIGYGLSMHDGFPLMDFAANRAEMEREKQGLELAIFQLSDRHREMGTKALKKLGLPKDAWYVTLHVRESGYRGETPANTTEQCRNANPLDYLKAIKTVTNAGGWVFRMGDPSMTPLPSMPQVIDYALHEIRSDWMDVFLGATCLFCIGTASGYFRIPRYFGVPVIFTNCINTVPYFSLMEFDLYLPRLLKLKSGNKYLSFQELLSPPISMFWSWKSYRDSGLHWEENTPEELEMATREMLERTAGSISSPKSVDDLQRRFKTQAETCGVKYGGRPVKAFAPISRDFLVRHADLLEGGH